VIDWGRVPWTLWLFVALTVGGVAWSEFRVSGPVAAQLLFAAITLAWMFALLRGVRWVWILTLVFNLLTLCINLLADALGQGAWYQFALLLAITAVYTGLLLLPTRRRYFSRRGNVEGTPAPAGADT
jgi:hypothetical protein